MGWNDHIDFDLHERINDRLEEGLFEEGTKEYGIARKVADEGLSSLSEKQRYVWDTAIVPIFERPVTLEEKMQKAIREDHDPAHDLPLARRGLGGCAPVMEPTIVLRIRRPKLFGFRKLPYFGPILRGCTTIESTIPITADLPVADPFALHIVGIV